MASNLVLIPNATVIITSDPKASMHFEWYEKLIVVEKYVELVHWLDSVPFINSSHISSIHLLHHLHAALMQDAFEQHCHYVMLSEESWEREKMACYDAKAEVVWHYFARSPTRIQNAVRVKLMSQMQRWSGP